MPKIDLSTLELRTGSIYPEPFASQMAGRSSLRRFCTIGRRATTMCCATLRHYRAA